MGVLLFAASVVAKQGFLPFLAAGMRNFTSGWERARSILGGATVQVLP